MNKQPKIQCLPLGPLQANCYLLADAGGRAAIIDPGGDPEEIFSVIEREGWTPVAVIDTHSHIDHVAANRPVVERYRVPLLIHRLGASGLRDPELNLSLLGLGRLDSPPADRELDDGDEIPVGDLTLKVISTPGHSPGSISLLLEVGEGPAVIFTGDTLFAGGVGRTDFPGGSLDRLIVSIRDRLLVFPDDTVILPGHGGSSTIGEERRGNFFIQQFRRGRGLE
jgi:hydroxyacylglutathione hydrolase